MRQWIDNGRRLEGIVADVERVFHRIHGAVSRGRPEAPGSPLENLNWTLLARIRSNRSRFGVPPGTKSLRNRGIILFGKGHSRRPGDAGIDLTAGGPALRCGYHNNGG
jgi:hypothetical protein